MEAIQYAMNLNRAFISIKYPHVSVYSLVIHIMRFLYNILLIIRKVHLMYFDPIYPYSSANLSPIHTLMQKMLCLPGCLLLNVRII